MSEWEIYLITRLDAVKKFFFVLGPISMFAAFFLFWTCLLENFEDMYKMHSRKMKYCIAVCVISVIACGLILTTKEFIAIKGIPPLIEGAKDLAPDLKRLLYQILERGTR